MNLDDGRPSLLADRVRARLADMPQAVQDTVEAQMALSAAGERAGVRGAVVRGGERLDDVPGVVMGKYDRFGVAEAVIRDLEAMPEHILTSTEAAAAVALARKLDAGGEISVAPVAKELREVMKFLRDLAGTREREGDDVDDLAAARAARRAASAG